MNELENRDIPVNIEDIMHTAYLQYSLSVNVGRAIPDVRDGLKPVNRRILFGMKQLGITKSHATVKCARVVGEVMGKYHPHGDSAVYDSLVRLAQDFSMREPLVEGQGNFGNIDGDSAAASRYTECRMQRLSEELLGDIEKNTVDMVPNFDETELEPSVLPAGFPNLLVNGTTGIGVGMATNIPPHNLSEVIDATVQLLDDPKSSVDELMALLPGPDFPTGGIIRGKLNLQHLYHTGRGSVRLRGKAEVEEQNGKERIIITEIPYAVSKESLVTKIADLVRDKRITGIGGLVDESSKRTGLRIVIDIKKGAMGSVVLNQLYAHTQLESSYGCIMLVVDHNRPRVMNLVQILQAYIDHRMEVVTRRTQFDLDKAEARAHILSGFLKALDNIDEVVSIIRASQTKAEASENLIARFEFTQIQANAILEMRLHQLTGMAKDDVQGEFDYLAKQIAWYKELLESREKRAQLIKDELLAVKEKFGNPRRTEITFDDSDLNIADLIPRHSCVITVSNTGYIKRVPADTYRTQHRGGVGIIGMETKEEDHLEHLFYADSHDLIFFFTDRGFMHWQNVYEIPEGSRTGRGKAIINMIKIEPGEKIRAMLTVKREEFEDENKFIIMASRAGYIKKTKLGLFANLRKTGLRALTIEDDDDLIGAAVTSNGDEIILSSLSGMACRFNQTDDEVRPMGRTARGVTGMRFKLANDCIVSMEVVQGQAGEMEEFIEGEVEGEESAFGGDPELIVVTDGGMGKRSLVATYRKTHRGARGVVSIKLKADEKVIGAFQISGGDELILTTEKGQLVRIPADEVRRVGRASKGVKIMNLRPGDKITGVARVAGGADDAQNNEQEEVTEAIVEVTSDVVAGTAATLEDNDLPEQKSDSDADNGDN